jgi:restriction endonuclease Mrr
MQKQNQNNLEHKFFILQNWTNKNTKMFLKMSSHKKGLSFEKRIVKMFKRLGYWNVKHNVTLRDKFGNISQIDLTFGLFRTFYVECKAYENSVKLEEVAKFKEVLNLNGIPLSRGIFITTSSFVPRAKTIGVKTIDGVELKELEKKSKRKSRTKFVILCLILCFMVYATINYTNFDLISVIKKFYEEIKNYFN